MQVWNVRVYRVTPSVQAYKALEAFVCEGQSTGYWQCDAALTRLLEEISREREAVAVAWETPGVHYWKQALALQMGFLARCQDCQKVCAGTRRACPECHSKSLQHGTDQLPVGPNCRRRGIESES